MCHCRLATKWVYGALLATKPIHYAKASNLQKRSFAGIYYAGAEYAGGAPGAEIGYDLEADKKRFEVTENGVVVIPKGAEVV